MSRAVRSVVSLALVVLIATSMSGTAGAREDAGAKASPVGKGTSDVYVVQLGEAPVAGYEGSLAGYPATKPNAGKKLDKRDPNVRRYAAYLRSRHDAVANGIGAARLYDYEYSFNGFAAPLSKSQVAALRRDPRVVSVERDALSRITTDNTPSFLGLNAPGGIWSQLGGQGKAGEDVVIGLVDTGIWPEHPSFSGAGYGPPPAGWNGECQPGEQWSQQHCNNKLIGARYYEKGYGHFSGGLAGDYQSARDHDGHGTHTASTAGGNAGVAASVLGVDRGTISGIAPRARIAAYKACWPEGCATTDLVAAIDAAVADGVDVINYSIGDGDPSFLDPDDVAFLFARAAGVFVAASAGNSGPGSSTVDHGGPWLTTVAASTQNRSFVGTATLGNGQSFEGVTLTSGIGSRPLVDAAAAGGELCLVGALDPAVVSGKIVLCKRGTNARVEKSQAVKQAGGVGMLLFNANDAQSLNADNHWVPSLHVNFTQGSAIRAYIASAGAGATASLSGGTKEFGGGNTMADFSSRGPLLEGTGDLLKPDITAPGVNILAGNSPTAFLGAPGQLFQAIGGTSMSSPHIAGVAALLKDLRPDLTPAELQSAIITSARQNVLKEDAATPADPFDFGGGHVVPNRAGDPGLVYPAAFDDYRAFLRSQGVCTLCFGTGPAPVTAATNLNVPSVTIRALAGTLTVTRTVKNVGAAGTYKVGVEAPNGVDVAVNPTELTLAAGQTASYQITFTANRRAVFNEYAFGALTWSDGKGGHRVRSPLVVRPVQLAAPASLTGTTASGSANLAVQFGYGGTFAAAPQGLIAATTETRTVSDDPTNSFDTGAPDANQGIQVHTFTVPTGTSHARLQLFDEFTDGNDDIDLYLYQVGTGGALSLVGSSAGGTSAERIDVRLPAPGTYKLYVHGWQTDGTSAVYTLFGWLVPSTAAGNLTATPSTTSATIGGTGSVAVSWSGLAAGTKYLGRISYSDGRAEIGSTLVGVNP
jgi:subtilisin family serine protease